MDVQHIDNTNNNHYQFVPSLIPPPLIKAKADSGTSNTIGDLRMSMHLAILKVQGQVQKLNCQTTKLFKQTKLESSIFQQPNFIQKE